METLGQDEISHILNLASPLFTNTVTTACALVQCSTFLRGAVNAWARPLAERLRYELGYRWRLYYARHVRRRPVQFLCSEAHTTRWLVEVPLACILAVDFRSENMDIQDLLTEQRALYHFSSIQDAFQVRVGVDQTFKKWRWRSCPWSKWLAIYSRKERALSLLYTDEEDIIDPAIRVEQRVAVLDREGWSAGFPLLFKESSPVPSTRSICFSDLFRTTHPDLLLARMGRHHKLTDEEIATGSLHDEDGMVTFEVMIKETTGRYAQVEEE